MLSIRSLQRLLRQQYTVYRSPSGSGSKVAAPVEIGTVGDALIVPASESGGLSLAAVGLAGGRSNHLLLAVGTPDVQPSDELRDGITRYKVEGVADWFGVTVASLERLAR